MTCIIHLQDEGLNGLLPFGEYVSPQQQQNNAAAWDLERFLIRLAASDQRRSSGHRRRQSRLATDQEAAPSQTLPRPIRTTQWLATGTPLSQDHQRNENNSSTPPSTSTGFPSSWPPFSGGEGSSSSTGGLMSPSFKSLKSKFASLNFRESINKTTKEIKQLLFQGSDAQNS